MRIGCLQFAPQVGDVDNNLSRADEILDRADPEDLDLLVLPELAFSGYNFKSLSDISPFLENPDSGISSLWARNIALKYDCSVIVGYPERVDQTDNWPADPEYYNAAAVVSDDGETIANYRKSHLYYTDETWALEGQQGFFHGLLPRLGHTAIGICMDLNPYKFQAPWDEFEFAHHVLESGAHLVVVSMAWITQDDPHSFTRTPREPDLDTLMYWVSRVDPIIRAELDEEIIVVFANRSGIEGDCTYAGTSAVIGIKGGEVNVYGILGRCDKELLVVNTESPPYAKLVIRRRDDNADVEAPNGNAHEDANFDDETNQEEKPSNGSHGSRGPSPPPFGESKSSSNDTEHQQGAQGSSLYRLNGLDGWVPRGEPGETDDENWSGSETQKRENRLSIRSDVSVWNNHAGRPPSVQAFSNPPQDSTPRTIDRAVPAPEETDRSTLQHTEPLKPRHDGRPREFARSTSATAINVDPGLAYRQSANNVSRVESAGASYSSFWHDGDGNYGLYGRDSRVSHRSVQATPIDCDSEVGDPALFRNVIPLAEGLGISNGPDRQESMKGYPPMSASAEPPVLRPTSRERILGGNDSPRGRRRERSSSRDADMYHETLQSNMPANTDDRAVSRGRRRGSRPPSGQTGTSTQPHNRYLSSGSRRRNQTDPETIDLSQFRLIEEYPSSHCPVHGSRSRSGTGRWGTPEVRRPSKNQGQSRRRRSNTRRSSQDTPTNPGRNQRPSSRAKPAAQTINSPPKADPAARAATATPTRSVLELTNPINRVSSAKEPKVRAKKEGPKTPVAMILEFDLEGEEEHFRTPLKCVERATMKAPMGRPRSAVL